MNKLGTSEKDNKRYEVLKNKEKKYSKMHYHFRKANQLNPKNEDVATTLLNVYGH